MNRNAVAHLASPSGRKRSDHLEQVDEVVSRLLGKLGRHHPATYEHSIRVGGLARRLATHLNMPPETVRKVTRAALLHDLGKVAVPAKILDKPTPLNEHEWSRIDLHCQIGADMLRRTKLLEDEAHLVLHHHRWYAANNCLSMNYVENRNAAIDLIAICDAYDAMISDRPYSTGQNNESALRHLAAEAGTQFNPKMIKALKQMLEAGETDLPSEEALPHH
ncbi:MAG: HD domain-containing phosphohydrolase [Phycisphaeraceae bacterium]